MAESSQEYSTIIGSDASFSGSLKFEKGMRLQGKFDGEITTPGRVHVASGAQMKATVEAGAIIVEGEVEGDLTASDRIELKNSARYKGNLAASKLVVEEGAEFVGHVSVGPDATRKGTTTAPGGMPRQQPAPPAQPKS